MRLPPIPNIAHNRHATHGFSIATSPAWPSPVSTCCNVTVYGDSRKAARQLMLPSKAHAPHFITSWLPPEMNYCSQISEAVFPFMRYGQIASKPTDNKSISSKRRVGTLVFKVFICCGIPLAAQSSIKFEIASSCLWHHYLHSCYALGARPSFNALFNSDISNTDSVFC